LVALSSRDRASWLSSRDLRTRRITFAGLKLAMMAALPHSGLDWDVKL
jgi:hypothetical protein